MHVDKIVLTCNKPRKQEKIQHDINPSNDCVPFGNARFGESLESVHEIDDVAEESHASGDYQADRNHLLHGTVVEIFGT